MTDNETHSTRLNKALPYDGELHPAKDRKYESCIVFVHHYDGNKSQMVRHVQMVNDFGFDAVTFNLAKKWNLSRWEMPVSANMEFGIKHLWADQITDVLNAIEGKKIVYAFSNPCGSAIEAIASRNAFDVTGLVCDGGPTGKLFSTLFNWLSENNPKHWWARRIATAGVYSYFWSSNYTESLHNDLEALPKSFPLLSIRGWRDPILPPFYIDRILGPHYHLDWRKLGLPEGGHLDGLKSFPDEYVPQVQRFLESFAN